MAYDTTITLRTNSTTKTKAQKLFNSLGMDMSTAVNIFLKRSIREGGVPFAVTLEEPNAVTLQAIDDAMNDRNMSGPYSSVEELMEALHAED